MSYQEFSYRSGFLEGAKRGEVVLKIAAGDMFMLLKQERKFLDLIYKDRWRIGKEKFTKDMDEAIWKYREGMKHGFYAMYEGSAFDIEFDASAYWNDVLLWLLDYEYQAVNPPRPRTGTRNPKRFSPRGTVICHLYGTHKEASK